MSTTILNFKKVEIVAESKEAAIAQIEETLFHVNGDATQAYKNWKAKQTKGITERDVKEFMLDYLAKKGKNCPGAGYMITVESATADTRERPYKIEDVKNEKGKRKYTTIYQIINDSTGEIIAEAEGTKAKAKEVLRKLYLEGLKSDVTCTYTKQVTEGEPVAFKGKYTPSKASHPGTYMVFGIEA